jgi:hypothetical protein
MDLDPLRVRLRKRGVKTRADEVDRGWGPPTDRVLEWAEAARVQV